MGLKDEMEKLIQNEQRRLEYRDNKRKNFHERQHERFQPIRKLVEELATSIEPDYLKVTVGDERAEIAVGTPLGQFIETDMEWYIEPNFRVIVPLDPTARCCGGTGTKCSSCTWASTRPMAEPTTP